MEIISGIPWVSFNKIIERHERIINLTGGAHGILNDAVIESARLRPFQSAGGLEIFPSLFEKVAAMTDALIRAHGFVDGNKRIAYWSGDICLRYNGFYIKVNDSSFVADFFWSMSRGEQTLDSIVKWLQNNTERFISLGRAV